MYPTISVPSLHLEHQLWVRELSFYKESIKIFEKHLELLINRNTGRAVRAKIEHFQNQFILQKEVIDELKHRLHVSEKQLAAFVYEMSGTGMDNIKMDKHTELRQEVMVFRKLYNELKEEFRRFETEWM